MSTSSRIRAFLALNFPVAVVRKIADDVEVLRRELGQAPAGAGAQIAWVPSPNLHVTLKFFGMIEPASTEAILGKLSRELRAVKPVDMEARGIGAFPSVSSPNVLWAGVHSAGIAALQQSVEGWMAELGFAREAREFHPHVTIGRVKSAGSEPLGPVLAPLCEARRERSFGSGRVHEIVLHESRTLRSGSEYLVLGRAALDVK